MAQLGKSDTWEDHIFRAVKLLGEDRAADQVIKNLRLQHKRVVEAAGQCDLTKALLEYSIYVGEGESALSGGLWKRRQMKENRDILEAIDALTAADAALRKELAEIMEGTCECKVL